MKRLFLMLLTAALILCAAVACADAKLVADGDIHCHNTLECVFVTAHDADAYDWVKDASAWEECSGCVGLDIYGGIVDWEAWERREYHKAAPDFRMEGGCTLTTDINVEPGFYMAVGEAGCEGELVFTAADGTVMRSYSVEEGTTIAFLMCERQSVTLPEHCVLCAVPDNCIPQEDNVTLEFAHKRMSVAYELCGFEYVIWANGPDAWYEIAFMSQDGDGITQGRKEVREGTYGILDLTGNISDPLIIELHNVTLYMPENDAVG